MTPAELITELRAALDADEAAARKAAAVCGCHPDAPSWAFNLAADAGRIVVVDDPHPGVRRKIGRRWNGSYEGMFTAQHIVRHDPARVLADIAAKRALIDRYEEHEALDRETFDAEGEHARSLVSLRAAYFDAVRTLAEAYGITVGGSST